MNPALMAPIVAGLGQGALHGGLSAYGNLAAENDRSKGDQRMILESALAALGAGIAGHRGRQFFNSNAASIARAAIDRAQRTAPGRFAAARARYQAGPLSALTPGQWVNLAGTSLAAGAGAGAGGSIAAPLLADQLGLVQAPGSWTRRADDWNWDRQFALEGQIADEVARRLGETGGAA